MGDRYDRELDDLLRCCLVSIPGFAQLERSQQVALINEVLNGSDGIPSPEEFYSGVEFVLNRIRNAAPPTTTPRPAARPFSTPAPLPNCWTLFLWDGDQVVNYHGSEDHSNIPRFTKAYVEALFPRLAAWIVKQGLATTTQLVHHHLFANNESVRWDRSHIYKNAGVVVHHAPTEKNAADNALHKFALDNCDGYGSIVIVSADRGFIKTTEALQARGKNVTIVHTAEPDSEHERTLEDYANCVRRLTEIAPPLPIPASAPAPRTAQPKKGATTPPSTRERRTGVVVKWGNHPTINACNGRIEDSITGFEYYFDQRDKDRGYQVQIGDRVSFEIVTGEIGILKATKVVKCVQ